MIYIYIIYIIIIIFFCLGQVYYDGYADEQ